MNGIADRLDNLIRSSQICEVHYTLTWLWLLLNDNILNSMSIYLLDSEDWILDDVDLRENTIRVHVIHQLR